MNPSLHILVADNVLTARLLLLNSRYEFEASIETVKQAGLSLSSKLLKLARRVK